MELNDNHVNISVFQQTQKKEWTKKNTSMFKCFSKTFDILSILMLFKKIPKI